MVDQVINRIGADEVFGTMSRLVTECNEVNISEVSSLGVAYQLTAGAIALLFIFILVRFFGPIHYLITSTLSNSSNRSDIHIYAAETKNIEIYTSIIGTLLIALLVMRLSAMEDIGRLLQLPSTLSAWEIGGLSLAGISALILGERILFYLVGAISSRNDACNALWQTKLLHFSIVIILLSPMIILILLTDGLVAKIALYTSVAVCSISLILFIKETFSLFKAQRFSIFHWILYLCALEIFPLSLLLAPIMRG